jgi:hypothetical protein
MYSTRWGGAGMLLVPRQEIARYVEDAQARQAPVQRFADRVVRLLA